MIIRIEFPALPAGRDLNKMREELDAVLEDDGWLIGSGLVDTGAGYVELDEDKVNPKYGIVAVKNYLQKAGFAPETTMELNGAVVHIYQ